MCMAAWCFGVMVGNNNNKNELTIYIMVIKEDAISRGVVTKELMGLEMYHM